MSYCRCQAVIKVQVRDVSLLYLFRVARGGGGVVVH
jgi:hypothetical protein